jgi:hypothetical protein
MASLLTRKGRPKDSLNEWPKREKSSLRQLRKELGKDISGFAYLPGANGSGKYSNFLKISGENSYF